MKFLKVKVKTRRCKSVHQRFYVLINKRVSKIFKPVQRAFEKRGICQQFTSPKFWIFGGGVQITRLSKSNLALVLGVLLGGSDLEMASSDK